MLAEPVVFNDNDLFNLAENFVNRTSRCIFLTGKAGTGKTTFLRHIRSTTPKNTVVVAPTGVAAIHAGGVTIHSFFQLPLTPFVPVPPGYGRNDNLFERYSLLRNLKLNSEKRKLLRELDLLIIDEISMVRCDVLDQIDVILRFFRKREHLPFGGVQVLMIGDLFQLPPVIPQAEWSILSDHYGSSFFFDSMVLREANPVYIELKKIYRQTDPVFINLLNRVRNSEPSSADIELLNARYDSSFADEIREGYVILTTHNAKAEKINNEALRRLDGEAAEFQGMVEGDFPERSFPTERLLQLKVGAQIMFIKNDLERIRRYYNGKIGVITRMTGSAIYVTFPREEGELEVPKETWRNVTYFFNPNTHEVDEEVIGTFTQYPIRLAWAITIHKSQGLTFDKLIIDAGASFAAGQVYVALSRCTSLEGVVLLSRIFRNSIRTDDRVLQFAEEELSPDQLHPILISEQYQYRITTLLQVFDWTGVLEEVNGFRDFVDEKKTLDKEPAYELIDKLQGIIHEQQEVTRRFSEQLRSATAENNFVFVVNRVDAAVKYYSNIIGEKIVPLISGYEDDLKNQKKVKQVKKKVRVLRELFSGLQEVFQRANEVAKSLAE